jgi:MFS family permease
MFYKISKKYSRLSALSITFLIGAIGSVVLFYSLIIDSFVLLMLGALILGFGQSATLQSRYAASFVASENFKATALSLAVWCSVFGSVFGPRLVSLYSEYFNKLFESELIVGYIVAMVGMLFASASVVTFTSSKSSLRNPAESEVADAQEFSNSKEGGRTLTLLLVLNHFTMVVIMSATPLHVQDIGETVQLVGVIISYHTLGMFLLSPILGSYVDRYGYRRFTYIGTGILFLSCLVTFINSGPTALKIGLYLLGLGWNFNYVAISSAISKFSIKYKSPLNIRSDSFVFLGSFTAHTTLGLSYKLIGYKGLVVVGMLVSVYLFLNLKNLKKLALE